MGHEDPPGPLPPPPRAVRITGRRWTQRFSGWRSLVFGLVTAFLLAAGGDGLSALDRAAIIAGGRESVGRVVRLERLRTLKGIAVYEARFGYRDGEGRPREGSSRVSVSRFDALTAARGEVSIVIGPGGRAVLKDDGGEAVGFTGMIVAIAAVFGSVLAFFERLRIARLRHLQRLLESGVATHAEFRREGRGWIVDYRAGGEERRAPVPRWQCPTSSPPLSPILYDPQDPGKFLVYRTFDGESESVPVRRV